MRVCERHIQTPAKITLKLIQTDETFDLCAACEEEFRAFLSPQEPPQEQPQRRRKATRDLAQAE